MNKSLITILIFAFFTHISVSACSMYKITKNGKTIVGNNEDWISPNNQFWFVPGEVGEYGVMNMGLLDNFAQGAINEAGLVFDGFAGEYLEVKNTEGKIDIPISVAVQKVMHSFSTVREVKEYFLTINLSAISQGHLVFVDKTGEYLIAEGDELIIGNEAEKAFSNFYYSQIKSEEEVELQNFKNGLVYLKSTNPEVSTNYCGSVMESFSNPEGFTQYSTIYDLEELTIRVYIYHDYSQYVEVDLKQELSKGEHNVMLAELFPKDSKGYRHYIKYNNPEDPTRFAKEFVGNENQTEQELVDKGIAFNLNYIGYEWLNQNGKTKGAIEIFKYATELMPNQSNLFDSLGEAYFKNKEYENAIKNYARSLVLNPQNVNAINVLQEIKREKEEAD